MSTSAVQFDETTATPIQSAGVTFDDSTAMPLPKAAPTSQPSSISTPPTPIRPQDTVSAAPPLTWSQRARESIANSVIGRSINTEMPGVAQALHLQPTESESSPTYQQNRESLPQLPDALTAPTNMAETPEAQARTAQTQAQFSAQHPRVAAALKSGDNPYVVKGLQGANQFIQPMTSYSGLAQLAALPEAKPLMALYSTQAAKGTYDSAEAAYEAHKNGDNPEAAKFAVETGLGALVTGLTGFGALHDAFPVDTGRPSVSEPSTPPVEFPNEPLQLGAGAKPPVEFPEDTPTLPLPKAAAPQLPATTAGEAPPNPQNSPPPVNPSTAVERTTPPTQFTPPAEIPADKGVVVDAEGNALINRPGLPAPRETAGKAKPIIPKIVPPPVPTPPLPPQPNSAAVMVAPPSNIQPAPDTPQAAQQTPATTNPPTAAPNAQASQNGEARPVVQASSQPAELRESAQDQKPALDQMASIVAAAVPGAEVVGPRVKSQDSIENKDDRGKPVETNIDNLGVRVVAPSPDAVPAVQQAIESQLPVVQKDSIDNNGLNLPQYGVQTGKPGEPNQVSEVQVIPSPAVADAMKDSDPLYAKQKEAQADLDAAKPGSWQAKAAQKEVDELGAQIAAKLKDAQQPENQGRAKLSESSEQIQLGKIAPGMKPVPPQPLGKGATVILKDGSGGIVQGGNPNFSSGGRWSVVTPNGTKTLKGSDLKPIQRVQAPGPNEGKWHAYDLDGTLAKETPNQANGQIGAPVPEMVAQAKKDLADGKDVRIFTSKVSPSIHTSAQIATNTAAIEAWSQKHLGVALPVTADKSDPKVTYDNQAVAVQTNTGKIEEPANEQRISTEQPAAAITNGGQKEAQSASSEREAAPVAVHPEREEGAGSKRGEGVAGQQQGIEPAGEGAKPSGEEGGKEEVKSQKFSAAARAKIETKEKPKTERRTFANAQQAKPAKIETPLDKFEKEGKAPYEITRKEWVELRRAHQRAIGQSEDSGTRYAPNSDYESYHEDSVKTALRMGLKVPDEVLKDYPDLLPKTKEAPKAEGDAVAPDTAPPSELEGWKKELSKIESQLNGRDVPGNRRQQLGSQASVLRGRIADAEHAVRVSGIPLTKPDDNSLPSPHADKWKYQSQYFLKALEPVKQAWIDRWQGTFDWDYLVDQKKSPWAVDPEASVKPKEFQNDFIRIEVPGDGKFLVKNTPAAIDKLLKSAPKAFAKPSETIPGSSKKSVPRAPKEIDTQALIKHLESRLDEAQQDLSRAKAEDEPTHQQEVESIKKEITAAKEQAAEEKKAKSDLGSTFYTGFTDPQLFNRLFPDIAERMADWLSDAPGHGDTQRAMMRQTRGEMDRKVAIAIHKLKGASKDWRTRSRDDSMKFWNAVEDGDTKSLAPKDQALANLFKGAFDSMRKQLQELKPNVLQDYIENYFPHIWERPSQVSATIKALLTGKKPFAGKGSFLKQRTIPTMQDGIDLGFKPMSWNPVDSFLTKYAEMSQFLMGHQTLEMMKESGTAKYVPVGERAPEGWMQVDDRIGTVYGNPNIPTKEYFDKHVWNALNETAKNLLQHAERKASIGGSRLGYYSRLDGIVTKANTPMDVLAHELGHAIDEVYGLKDQLVKDPQFKKELRALADLRIEDETDVSASHKRYIRKGEEKMAAIFQSYAYIPDRFEEVAPKTFKHISDFIASHPELAPLKELKRGLVHEGRQNTVNAGGMVIRGYYYAPAEAAKIFNNFVSKGIAGRSGIYDTLNWMNQNLNALQLGISAFHASTTSINAATSDVALGIQQLAEGKPFRAGVSLAKGASVIPSLIHTMVNGSRLMHEYLTPGSYAKMNEEANALANAGGRIRQNTIELKPLDKVINGLRNGAIIDGLTPLPGAILHAAVAPVMDYYVPRMKLGAFYAMAHDILDSAQKQGWTETLTRSRMQEAWDSIDNRFGQVVYDNLFWHKGVRDALNLSTRSVGWNFGSYRELGGAVADVGKAAGRAGTGQIPRVTPRLAFGIALPLVSALFGGVLNYLWTGKKPETWKDYFYPKTTNGERHSIPGYMKDVFSFANAPGKTVLNKMAPIWGATAEAIENRDFYGTEIRHKDDPVMKQLAEFSRWAAAQAIPFSVSGAEKLLQQRGSGPSLQEMLAEAKKHPGDVALGQLGFQPAPAFIQNSPAINAAREYNQANRPPGTKTAEQTAHYQALDAISEMYRTGDIDQTQIDKYVDEGKVTDKDVRRAERESDEPPIVRAVKNLTIEQMLNVWEKASADERDDMEPILDRHERDIEKVTDEEQRDKLYKAFDKAMGEAARQPATAADKGII